MISINAEINSKINQVSNSQATDYLGTNDKTYLCIAYERVSNNKIEKLDVHQSIAKGGYYKFSMKINFMRAIVSREKDTINNIKYKDMKFTYRTTMKGYDAFYHDYDKDFFVIKNNYAFKPYLSMVFTDGTKLSYLCEEYTE